MIIKPNNECLQYSGRIIWDDIEAPIFIYTSTWVKIRFTGSWIKVFLDNKREFWDNYVGYIIDGVQHKQKLNQTGRTTLEISVDTSKEIHELLVFKRQDSCHEMTFLGMEIPDDGCVLDLPPKSTRRIEVYGDSVSAGEVSEAVDFVGKNDPEHNGEYSNCWYSYAWMTARALNAEIHNIAQGGIALLDETGYFAAPNYLGMESSWDKFRYNPTFGERNTWDFSQYIPQVVIVAIGQNDNHPVDFMKDDEYGEKAIVWKKAYRKLLDNILEKYPDAYIVCCTTLLIHDPSWDRAISSVIAEHPNKRISKCEFKRNGAGTPGHLRIPEAEEMARELVKHIENLHVEGWE